MDPSSELELDDAVGSDQAVSFTDGTGTLSLHDLSSFSGKVISFQKGDTIDLVNITANEADFDPSTGDLTLYDTTYGQSIKTLGTISLSGLSSVTGDALYLTDDGNGGTDIKLGTSPPNVNQLADLANATYKSFTSTDGYLVLPNFSQADNGFLGEAFTDDPDINDQIVIAIRGTNFQADPSFAKNLIADASFISLPTIDLIQYVAEASSLLYSVRQAYPNADITLTGHSLGGAIAALLSQASGYDAVTFDAPGSAQLEALLAPALADAFQSNSELNGFDYNYRLEGDQISLVGTQFGTVENSIEPGRRGMVELVNKPQPR